MKFDVLTLFPDMINQACSHSIIARGVHNGIICVNTVNPRDFTNDKHKKVDDTPYGGGAGMVLMCQPYFDAFDSIEKDAETEVIILSPQGETFSQKISCELSQKKHIIMICGHYEGFDERIKTYTKAREISVGDYVLTGGELPALCVIDSVSRNIEGFLGKLDSAHFDSFSDGLLEYPQYTKPREYHGMKVPDVLLSGNHSEIDKWRRKQQFLITYKKRKDLFEKFKKNCNSKNDIKLLNEVLKEIID
ncbi:MAG: tRNA (guanosine(37)-N1)-methyltransferase TrmD [Clostridium sp.]|nr:tRNA (guanosine(37)-N1)-methyltransferase TrmD [Clostridium sp.]